MIRDYAGLGRRNPVLALGMAISLVSLMGIPPTAGFWAKLNVFRAAMETDLVWLAIVGMINSVISAYFYLRVIKAMYLAPYPREGAVHTSPPVNGAMALSVLGVLFMGVVPNYVMDLVGTAVTTLA